MSVPPTACVNGSFTGIQGEGVNVGRLSYFVRLAGCSLRCSWCDTKYAWEPDSGKDVSCDRIIDDVAVSGLQHVILTGGEPLEQPEAVVYLVRELTGLGIHVELETNGAVAPPVFDIRHGDLLYWSISPKLPSSGHNPSFHILMRIMHQLLHANAQFKFVVRDHGDIESAEKTLLDLGWEREKLGPTQFFPVVLQPEHPLGLGDIGADHITIAMTVLREIALTEPWRTWQARVIPQVNRLVWGDEQPWER